MSLLRGILVRRLDRGRAQILAGPWCGRIRAIVSFQVSNL